MRSRAVALAALLGCGLLPAAHAQNESLEMGRDIALAYCANCHNVKPGGPFKLDPPSFAAIAVYRTPSQIRQRIIMPIHEMMPRYSEYMIGGNIDDMVAYIVSLEATADP